MVLWHIANTTVRTPYRLRNALSVLQGSSLNGNISGERQEHAFAVLLHTKGILDAPRIESGEDASDLGRKWRVALSQLGFITPQLPEDLECGGFYKRLSSSVSIYEEFSGRPYEITPNGYRLIQAELITTQQECFLRSLASYRIPSPIEKNYEVHNFSPLRFVLNLIHSLSESGLDPRLSLHEFALFVQTSTPSDGIETIVQRLREYRDGRSNAKGNVRNFDRKFYEDTAALIDRKHTTLNDYADLSLRYLKATGLFRNDGRGITLSPTRTQLVTLLREDLEETLVDEEYFYSLWNGATLPTDDAASSFSIVYDLSNKLNSRGVDTEMPMPGISLVDLEKQRHQLEEQLLQLDEQDYAAKQSEDLDEILAWLRAIPSRGSSNLPDGSVVSIPAGEGPAYLEWAIWRALLAIDSLCNKPWEARRFQIDQDFLPVHHAPGHGPDMIFEFQEAIIVVEVTLTSSSRQEAAEGEPVRRHVAQIAEQSHKPVYGLFIAVDIDSNTANTFRSGDWFLKDDEKINLSIVPMTLGDFEKFLASGKGRLSEMPKILMQLILECRSLANQEAPTWKNAISRIVKKIVNDYNAS